MNRIVSKILDAERHGFKISYSFARNDGGVLIEKEIKNPKLDGDKCEEKYWAWSGKICLNFYMKKQQMQL